MIVSVIILMDVEYVMVMVLPVQVVLILMHSIMTVIMEKYHLVIITLSLMMAAVSTIRMNSNLINPKCRHFILSMM